MGVLPLACHRDKSIKLTLQIRKVSFFISYCLPDCSIFQKSVTAPREAEETMWAYLPRTLRLYSGGKVVSALWADFLIRLKHLGYIFRGRES